MSHDTFLFEQIELIYAAAAAPERWQDVLRNLTEALGGTSAVILSPGQGAHELPTAITYNIPDGSLEAYGKYYYRHDLWRPAWLNQGFHAPGSVSTSDQLAEPKEFLNSLWFNDFLKPQDIERTLIAALVDDTLPPDLPPTVISINRPLGAEPFGRREARTLRFLSRHLARALGLQMKISNLQGRLAAEEEVLEAFFQGIVSLDLTGRLIYANQTAERHLEKKEFLTQSNGRISGVTPKVSDSLHKLLKSAKHGLADTIALLNPERKHPFVIRSLPAFGTGSNALLDPNKSSHHAIWYLSDRKDEVESSIKQVAWRYGLTSAEQDILSRLVEGYRPEEIASFRSVETNTIRVQMKRLLGKTDTRRQADLIKLVLGNA